VKVRHAGIITVGSYMSSKIFRKPYTYGGSERP
jgi:hypothetical protein